MSKKVIVIGSGFGGLGAAVRLQAVGYDVELIEKLDKPGGRAYVFEQDGFTFDAGPTIITVPFMLDDIWNLAGKSRDDYFQMVECDPFYRVFDHKGDKFDYKDDDALIREQIRQRNPDDIAGYERYMEVTKAIFEKGFVELADQPFSTFMDMLRVAPDLIKLQSYKSVWQFAAQYMKDDLLRRAFTFHPLLIGGNPYDSPSIYAMIDYLQREWGVHYVMGGTNQLVAAMARLFQDLGGKVTLNTEVDEILVDDQRRATGVRLKDGSKLAADAVVSNADVAWTYLNMIKPEHRRKWTDWRVKALKYSMSLFVIYFGTKRQYRDQGLAHHNIILGERYKGLLNDIFRKKIVADDFSLYLHMPTITDPSIAPEGHESFYVLSPVPHLGSGTDWKEMAKPYRDSIMQYLEDNYLPGLQENLVTEHYIDPLYFHTQLNSHLGAAFSVRPLLMQSAWFRPHNRSEDIGNLYFVGAGTHPGAGVPGTLSSSIIAQNLIMQDVPLTRSQPVRTPQPVAGD